MNFHILTLFPEMVLNGLNTSITGRAVEQKLLNIEAVNIRDFSTDKHNKVDDYPYGGGAGMLMQAQPVYDACQSVFEAIPVNHKKRVLYVTPQGTPFCQKMAEEFSLNDDIIILCGHYEGIDERVLEEVVTDYVSIGDYVLTGGELAAMVITDAIARLVPGVLNNDVSSETESFHGGLLEYPQYSRPQVWHNKEVPQVLLSGNQKKINEWRLSESVKRTKERRPDLYQEYEQLQACKSVLMKQKLLHIAMIEQINRGMAKFIARDGDNILIESVVGGIFYFTALDDKKDGMDLWNNLPKETLERIELMVIHQEKYLEPIKEFVGLQLLFGCSQVCYTKKEQLPITGLYRNDGKENENGFVIVPAKLEDANVIASYYERGNIEYIIERIQKRAVYMGYINGELAGYVGVHDEGSIGMLEVLPLYRGRKIGKALETFMINQQIRQGMIPFGHVVLGNDVSENLQNSLGLCRAKTPIFWLEK